MQKFLNNFTSAFAASVKDTPVTGTPATELDYGILRLSDGAAGLLTNPSSGDYYLLTAYKRSGTSETMIEVIKVTAVNNSVEGECRITVLRGQENTAVQAYVSGDYVSLRITKGTAANLIQETDERLSDARAPSGASGGVLAGTFPNPTFATPMATTADLAGHTDDLANPHATTKAHVGLGNVDNTADATKPVSTAQQTALDEKQASLVSGTNLRTINGASLLGSTNIVTGDVTLTAAQTLTNKTITETVFALTGTTPAFTATNGAVQTWTLTAASSPTNALTSGQSIILVITPGSFAITWPGATWTKIGGSGALPALFSAGKTTVVLWMVGSNLYGSHLGDTA
jgi:hypothetical protein